MIEYKEDLSTEVVTYDTGISVTSNLTNKKQDQWAFDQ